MGRGRAKAKQAKVARQLKYNTPEMDLDRLQRELAGKPAEQSSYSQDSYEDDDYEDQYAEWADEDWDEDEDDEPRR